MAFKLTKDELKAKADHVEKLRKQSFTLMAAVEAFNEELENQWFELNTAVTAYNEALNEARGFAADIASQAESDIGEKSEKWQEGERGQAAQEWQGEWNALVDEFEDVEIDFPSELSLDEPVHADELEGSPDELGD